MDVGQPGQAHGSAKTYLPSDCYQCHGIEAVCDNELQDNYVLKCGSLLIGCNRNVRSDEDDRQSLGSEVVRHDLARVRDIQTGWRIFFKEMGILHKLRVDSLLQPAPA